MKQRILFFVLINLFFASFYIDSWHNANTTSRVLHVLCSVDQGTFKIDSFADKTIDKSFVNGHYYSEKAPLPAFVIIPFYAAFKAMGLTNHSPDFDTYSRPAFLLGSFICGSIPYVLICYLFFIYASKYTNERRAAILSMVFLYSSFVFVFSGTFFTHVFSAALLLLSYINIKEKKYFYSGLFLGLSFLSDYTAMFIIPIWAIQIFINERSFKKVITYGIGLTPSLLLFLLYNKITTGSAFDVLYNYITMDDTGVSKTMLGFRFPHLNALYGLTISPYRGLLIYCPMLIFALIYYLKDKQKKRIEWIKNYLIFITIGYFLILSSYFVWWGGWSYGPRQLMPIAVLLLFESVIYISKIEINKFWFWTISSILILFTWMIKNTIVYSVPTEIKNPFTDFFFQNAINGMSNPNNILTMNTGISAKIAAIIWLILFGTTLYLLGKKLKKI